MIVRMFKPQFSPKVESREKRQTVRPTPKRMPNVGDEFRQSEQEDRILNEFAQADGFSGWQAMRDWFAQQHGLPFDGIVTYWK